MEFKANSNLPGAHCTAVTDQHELFIMSLDLPAIQFLIDYLYDLRLSQEINNCFYFSARPKFLKYIVITQKMFIEENKKPVFALCYYPKVLALVQWKQVHTT